MRVRLTTATESWSLGWRSRCFGGSRSPLGRPVRDCNAVPEARGVQDEGECDGGTTVDFADERGQDGDGRSQATMAAGEARYQDAGRRWPGRWGLSCKLPDWPPGGQLMAKDPRVLLGSAVTLNGGDAAIALGAERFLADAYGSEIDMRVLDSQAAVAEEYRGSEFAFLPALHTTTPGPDAEGLLGSLWRTAYRARRRLAPGPLKPSSPARRKVVGHLRTASLVAATGGTYFVDNYAWGARLEEYEIALSAGVPVVFLTQSMGPFANHDQQAKRLGAVLRSARAVLVRDPESLEAVARVSPDATVRVAPDMAFALQWLKADGKPATTAVPEQPQPTGAAPGDHPDRLRVGVSVRHWQHFSSASTDAGMRRYLEAVAAVVTSLVRHHDAHVEFTSTCQGIPSYRYDDARTADLVVKLLDDDVVSQVAVDRAVRSTMATLDHLGRLDLLVSTRMHQVILGWIASVPTVGIAYEPKTTAMFARHGIQHLAHDIEQLRADGMMRSISEQLADDYAAEGARARAVRERSELAEIAASWHASGLLVATP